VCCIDRLNPQPISADGAPGAVSFGRGSRGTTRCRKSPRRSSARLDRGIRRRTAENALVWKAPGIRPEIRTPESGRLLLQASCIPRPPGNFTLGTEYWVLGGRRILVRRARRTTSLARCAGAPVGALALAERRCVGNLVLGTEQPQSLIGYWVLGASSVAFCISGQVRDTPANL